MYFAFVVVQAVMRPRVMLGVNAGRSVVLAVPNDDAEAVGRWVAGSVLNG